MRAPQARTSLDEDALGHLETDIRTLGQLIRKGDNAVRIGIIEYIVHIFFVNFSLLLNFNLSD